ncbi:hypothetical protein Q3G72_003480 [Acer saccharum]|nr:hypothetical protein Q3G72_003480 [Acer saccharum]
MDTRIPNCVPRLSDSFTSVHSLSLSCLDLYQLFQRCLYSDLSMHHRNELRGTVFCQQNSLPGNSGQETSLFSSSYGSSLTKNIAICQRLNSEYLSKVFQKHLRYIGGKSEMMHVNQNALSNDATAPGYYVESGVSTGRQG